MADLGRRITFVELLETCQRIEVPQLQRDYVQGSESAREVRDGFLFALYEALMLPSEHAALPLNLDFVYGSMESKNGKYFLPLDGQQRLTTLFLLHWYLAWRDERLDEFSEILWNAGHSRFSYAVRPSSAEFFDELVQYVPDCSPDCVPSVKRLIEDQHWFYLHWRLDPTIQSALPMLDAMHERFKDRVGLFNRLLDRNRPAITFQLLPLDHFGLSDDLYIKMNARGKPLTDFETFKARFEQQLIYLYPTDVRSIGETSLSVHDFFSRRMDTQWTDFFWRFRTPKTTDIDKAVMNLFWVVAWVSIEAEGPATGLYSARHRQEVGSYSAFHELGLLTRAFTNNLICLLEAWSAGSGILQSQLPEARYFDEVGFFYRAILYPESIQYSDLVIFGAFVSYLSCNEMAIEATEFQSWMRVVYNLVQNSDIERSDDFDRCLGGIGKLLPQSRQILTHLATMEPVHLGFSREQVQEESLKSKLLLAHSGWEERIYDAEAHGYFRGQIGFLLDFSGVSDKVNVDLIEAWMPEVHVQLQEQFDNYLGKAKLTFNGDGLVQLPGESHQWERSLLAVGNFLVRHGRNLSFLTNRPGNPDSWKRFLRGGINSQGRQYLKVLWDRIDLAADLKSQLAAIRSVVGLERWRAAMVAYPMAMAYCGEHEMRWEEEFYLLRKRQMNGAHAELFSYVLYIELMEHERLARLKPLVLEQYQSVTMTDTEPHVLLILQLPSPVRFKIKSRHGYFRIVVQRKELELIPDAVLALTSDLEFADGDDFLSLVLRPDGIHDILFRLASKLGEIVSI